VYSSIKSNQQNLGEWLFSMKLKLILRICVMGIFLAVVGYSFREAVAQDAKVVPEDKGAIKSPPVSVSMIRLVAVPEKYNHKKIRTLGYVSLGFEADSVFPHQDDVKQNLVLNGVWLDLADSIKFDPDKVDGKYCIIEATVLSDKHGHFGMYSATLTSIERIEVWSAPAKKSK
jgi:hypothetical protein